MRDEGKAAFWDKKAETFPRFEAGEDNYEAGMLALARELGVDFHDRTVLDVGCGSGMYTLRLAREARRVTAVDISGRMLDILREDAARLGLGNIDYVRSDWDDFKSDERFDVVFCSMTPAIESDASRRKLLGLSRGQTVFMGFAGVMDSDMLGGLFAKYGVTPQVFNNGPEMREWLDAEGVPYRNRLVKGQWVVRRDKAAAVHDCTAMLMPYGVTPDPEFMASYMEAFREAPDVYVERTDYKIEMLVWESGDAGSRS